VESTRHRDRLNQRETRRQREGTGLLHLPEHGDALGVVFLDVDRNARVGEDVLLDELFAYELRDFLRLEPFHAKAMDVGEIDRPVGRDAELFRKLLLADDGQDEDVTRTERRALDGWGQFDAAVRAPGALGQRDEQKHARNDEENEAATP